MSEYQLPRQDDLGFCNILISALGGDGPKRAFTITLAGQIERTEYDPALDARKPVYAADWQQAVMP